MRRALGWLYLVGGCALGAIGGAGLLVFACRGVPEAPPRLTWSASFLAQMVGSCRDTYEDKLGTERAESYCNCFIPELMRASPAPEGQITHAEVQKATNACIHLVPESTSAPAPEPSGVPL